MKNIVFFTALLISLFVSACANRNDRNGVDTEEREPVNQYNVPTDTTDSITPPTPAPINH